MSEISVSVDVGASPGEVDAVREMFSAKGLEVEVRANFLRLSAEELPWVLMIGGGSVAWVVKTYVQGFVTKAGEDSWDALRAFLTEAKAARGGRPGLVTLEDPDGPDVQLDPDMPDAALRELLDLDWSAMASGRLGWSQQKGWWYLDGGGAPRPAPRRL